MIKKISKKILFLFKFFFHPNYYFEIAKSQNNNEENIFLKSVAKHVKTKNFVEIGFHHMEFNCIGLMQNGFSGLLIDGGCIKKILIL